MVQTATLTDFLAAPGPILDVRAPIEFAAGHLPGAISFPLFSDDERARIGTTYKQINADKAVLLGLDFFGPKMSELVRQAKKLAPGQAVRVHCWRGGLRSGAVAWLLDLAGLETRQLIGGYKVYRHAVLAEIDRPRALRVLGGMTGSGKTAVLHSLAALGEPVLDLEGIARHKGSAFGAIGQPTQPTQEQFENDLAAALVKLPADQPIWVEDESRSVGAVTVSAAFYENLRAAPLVVLDVPRPARVARLAAEYGVQEAQQLALAVMRIGKRLGGLATQQALSAIIEGDMTRMVEIVLDYYDKSYQFGLEKRAAQILAVPTDTANPAANAARVRAAILSPASVH
ncbi:MAG: tRNA 2-selenouridine(34) synthase MnmH [Hymenobacteraceae bacterium]|nr:tRNA 2-selenouridine(34) synthase MnmH [Hymenobacteraceae bacterium]